MFKLILTLIALATGVSLLSATAAMTSSVQASASSADSQNGNQIHVPGQRGIVVSAFKGATGLARNVTVEAGQMVSSVASGVTKFAKHSFRAVAAALSRSVNRIRGKHLMNNNQDALKINVPPGNHIDINLDTLNKVESSGGAPDELVNTAASS